MQLIAVGGENTRNDKPALLHGFDGRIFIQHMHKCNDECAFGFEIIKKEGYTAEADDSYGSAPSSEIGDYILAGSIVGPAEDKMAHRDNRGLSKLQGSMKMGNLKLSAGLNHIIQQDSQGEFKAGWERNDVRTYHGFGFEGFANPFLWNKMLKGISADVKSTKNLRFSAIYGTAPHQARSLAGAGIDGAQGNGFFESNYLAQIGAHYRMKGTKCYLGCQQIQNDEDGAADPTQNWDGPHAAYAWEEEGVMTFHARQALHNQETSPGRKTNAYTAVTSHKVQPGVELNCAISAAPTPNSTVLKWSIGAVSKPKGICAAYGLNLGTPAYVQQSSSSIQDEIPLVCEASAHFSFCGMNIPIFINYMNRKESYSGSGSVPIIDRAPALICGLRPSKIAGITTEGEDHSHSIVRTILECKTEGGEDEDEDEDSHRPHRPHRC